MIATPRPTACDLGGDVSCSTPSECRNGCRFISNHNVRQKAPLMKILYNIAAGIIALVVALAIIGAIGFLLESDGRNKRLEEQRRIDCDVINKGECG